MKSVLCQYPFTEMIKPKSFHASVLKFVSRIERKILKVVLLGFLHKLFYELWQSKIQCNINNYSMECYEMDNTIIKILIQDIIDTDEYTLEGIALHTRIPFDIIYDATNGINKQLSITLWVRVIDLYLQVKPEVLQRLVMKLLEIKNENYAAFSFFLSEDK